MSDKIEVATGTHNKYWATKIFNALIIIISLLLSLLLGLPVPGTSSS